MGAKSGIEWTDSTWNPVTGCTRVSPGCDNCYAERIAERFRNVKGHPFEFGFDLTLRHHRLHQPLSWKKPLHIFVNSMSDLFHKDIPFEFTDKVFDTMEAANWHQFQILTKRSSIMRDYFKRRYACQNSPAHIWAGASIEDSTKTSRIEHVRATQSGIRFLSIEPLIGPINYLDLSGIDWIIVGGESGPRARPLHPDWVRRIRDFCKAQNKPFFFKQWGGPTAKSGGRELDGETWDEFPTISNGLTHDQLQQGRESRAMGS